MKPIAATALSLVAALSLLVGLDAFTGDTEGTLDRIARTGEFVIGYREDANPLSYENAAGKPAGYSIDLCRQIASAVKAHLHRDNIETKFVRVSQNDPVSAVADGRIDIACTPTTITIERQNHIDFTLPTFVSGGTVLSLKKSGIKSLVDITNKKVGVVKGTATIGQLRNHMQRNRMTVDVVIVADKKDGMNKLDRGEIDAFASDQTVLMGQIVEASYPTRYVLADGAFSYQPYGLAVRRNDADFRVVADSALAELYRSGRHTEIYDRWIGRIGVRPSGPLAAMYQLNTIPE